MFGMNLEAYFADGPEVYKAIFDSENSTWQIRSIEGDLPSANVMSLNACNQTMWDEWMKAYYASLFKDQDGTPKPHNMRWYASMVSDMKRLILQGGLFAYPSANRKGYEEGHLRLVYEAIPMSFLIHAMGGSSTNGDISLLNAPVKSLHQKTPVFIGETKKIKAIEAAKAAQN